MFGLQRNHQEVNMNEVTEIEEGVKPIWLSIRLSDDVAYITH